MIATGLICEKQARFNYSWSIFEYFVLNPVSMKNVSAEMQPQLKVFANKVPIERKSKNQKCRTKPCKCNRWCVKIMCQLTKELHVMVIIQCQPHAKQILDSIDSQECPQTNDIEIILNIYAVLISEIWNESKRLVVLFTQIRKKILPPSHN